MSDTVRDLFDNGRVQMAQVIAALIAGRTVAQVADETGIPRGRITRWYRESNEFQEMLVDVEDAVISEIREMVVAEQSEAVVNLMPKARAVLEELLDSDKDSVRATAVGLVYRLSGYDGKHEPARGQKPLAPSKDTDARPAAGD